MRTPSGVHLNPREQQERQKNEPINSGAFRAMIAQIAANNCAGGWRKLKDR